MTKIPYMLSSTSRDALSTLGALIAQERRRARWTEAELAERIGVSRSTVRNIEAGHPGVAIGTVFEAAHLTGVPLVREEQPSSAHTARRERERLAVLPRRVVRRSADRPVDDDF